MKINNCEIEDKNFIFMATEMINFLKLILNKRKIKFKISAGNQRGNYPLLFLNIPLNEKEYKSAKKELKDKFKDLIIRVESYNSFDENKKYIEGSVIYFRGKTYSICGQ